MLYSSHFSAQPTILTVQTHPSNPKAACSCRRVHLCDFEHDWLLTEVFHDPDLFPYRILHHGGDSWSAMTPLTQHHQGILPGARVFVIRRVLDKGKVARLLITLLVVSPGFGILVGICSRSAGAGIAVSAGIFALASFIQGLTAWVVG